MSDADRTRGPFHAIRGGKDDPPPPGGSVRRLASILAADISGYSRLMQVDEEGRIILLNRVTEKMFGYARE